VVGIDLSEKMLARAREATSDPAIEYRRSAIEDIDFPAGTFDVVISSLALHYVEQFDRVCFAVERCLADAGAFVMSVEHPIFTAREEQDWHYDAAGSPLHWPIDNYLCEGIRRTRWLTDVVKYHRTTTSYVNALMAAGFRIAALLEPAPPAELLEARPELAEHLRRPMFLLVAATKGQGA